VDAFQVFKKEEYPGEAHPRRATPGHRIVRVVKNMILAADVGGTKTNVAHFREDADQLGRPLNNTPSTTGPETKDVASPEANFDWASLTMQKRGGWRR